MPFIRHACDLMHDGETAVVVHARPPQITINPDGTGSTGNWNLDRKRAVKRVIIFSPRNGDGDGEADVYLGDCDGMPAPSNEPRRYLIHFRHLKGPWLTRTTWRDFADAGWNPVRFVYQEKAKTESSEKSVNARGLKSGLDCKNRVVRGQPYVASSPHSSIQVRELD